MHIIFVVGNNSWWGIFYTWKRLYSVCCYESFVVLALSRNCQPCCCHWAVSRYLHPSCVRHELRICWAAPTLSSWQNGAGLLHSWDVCSALCLWSFADLVWFRLCFFKKKSWCITCISNQLGSCRSNRMSWLFILGIEWRRAGIILTSWCNQLSVCLTSQLSYIKRQCLSW